MSDLKIIIVGGAGSGKTRLAHQLGLYLSRGDAKVVIKDEGLEVAPSVRLSCLPKDLDIVIQTQEGNPK